MTHSFSQVYVHIIYHVKDVMSLINPKDENELYKYIGGLIKISKSIPIQINGTEDHIHILCVISKNISLADFMEEIKTKSSRWIKTKGTQYRYFEWQAGYAGYSVSKSKVGVVTKYIQNQKEHHKQQTTKDEFIQFLQENEVEFDIKYLWK